MIRLLPFLLLSGAAAADYDEFPSMDPVPKPPDWVQLRSHYSLIKPMNLNPGFVTKKGFQAHKGLQACVDERLAGLKRRFGKNIGVALVDLTGDKIREPEFAQYNSWQSMYGASQSKTGALLAAHQLLFDLQKMAEETGETDIGKFTAAAAARFAPEVPRYRLKDKFDLTVKGGRIHVAFSRAFKDEFVQMIRISNNRIASRVILKLGFNYIASVLWQTGIYDPARGGGLWVGRAYAGGKYWHRDPVGNQSHGISPFSMARYMTLLAQGRLVSPEQSISMREYLSNTRFRIKFVRSLIRIGLSVNKDNPGQKNPAKRAVVFRKSGTMKGSHRISHDATIILRTVCRDKACKESVKLRYVATGASQHGAVSSMPSMGQKLDECIRRNNGVTI